MGRIKELLEQQSGYDYIDLEYLEWVMWGERPELPNNENEIREQDKV